MYRVRRWCEFDFAWYTTVEGVSFEEAMRVWNEKTRGGTVNTDPKGFEYYKVEEDNDAPRL